MIRYQFSILPDARMRSAEIGRDAELFFIIRT